MTEQTGFYYPELYEERLISSVRSGDGLHMKTLLELSKKENFELRKLTRNKFLKLNNRFINTIIKIEKSEAVLNRTEELNSLAIHFEELLIDNYYDLLFQTFDSISDDVQQYKIGKRSKLTEKLKTYVDKHYFDSNLGLSMMSIEFNISEGYVSTLFKEQAGINFADYVEKLRIEQACILLNQNRMTIVQIAEQVGYNSIQSFRRAFKKVKGVSPSKLRDKD
jgi:YesN/AraC family two-component response regulator